MACTLASVWSLVATRARDINIDFGSCLGQNVTMMPGNSTGHLDLHGPYSSGGPWIPTWPQVTPRLQYFTGSSMATEATGIIIGPLHCARASIKTCPGHHRGFKWLSGNLFQPLPHHPYFFRSVSLPGLWTLLPLFLIISCDKWKDFITISWHWVLYALWSEESVNCIISVP